MNDTNSRATKTVRPDQMGWLHRIELDRNNVEIWEKPDGKLYIHSGPTKLTLQIPDRRRKKNIT